MATVTSHEQASNQITSLLPRDEDIVCDVCPRQPVREGEHLAGRGVQVEGGVAGVQQPHPGGGGVGVAGQGVQQGRHQGGQGQLGHQQGVLLTQPGHLFILTQYR